MSQKREWKGSVKPTLSKPKVSKFEAYLWLCLAINLLSFVLNAFAGATFWWMLALLCVVICIVMIHLERQKA